MNIVMVEEFNLRIKISSNFIPQFYALSFHSNDFPLSHNFIGKYYLRAKTRLDTKKKESKNHSSNTYIEILYKSARLKRETEIPGLPKFSC